MKNKKHKLEIIQLFIVGFYLSLEGYEMISDHAIIGGIILLFGVILLLYFIYELIKTPHNKTLKLLVHLFEAIALLFAAYIFFKEDKHYLQYVTLVASIGSFISVIVMLLKKSNSPDN